MATHCNILAWENPMDREAWQATIHTVAKSLTRLNNWTRDFPGGSDGKLPTMWETWVGIILWRRKWQTTSILLPGKSRGWRSLIVYNPWGHKESDMTEWLTPSSRMLSSYFKYITSETEIERSLWRIFKAIHFKVKEIVWKKLMLSNVSPRILPRATYYFSSNAFYPEMKMRQCTHYTTKFAFVFYSRSCEHTNIPNLC